MQKFKGFLISRQWREAEEGFTLRYWLSTETGSLLVEQTSQEGIFFVESLHLPKALNIVKNLCHRSKPLDLKSFSQHSVSGFYFLSQKKLRSAAYKLKELNIPPLEADVRTVDRYLMERFITSTMLITGNLINHPLPKDKHQHIINASLKPVEYTPNLRTLSFDIETNYLENTLLSIAVFSVDIRLIFMIGSTSEPDCWCYKSEKALLIAFIQWLQDYDPDLLIGWNCINFDLRFLHNACLRLGLKFNIGRNNEALEWRTSSKSNSSNTVSYTHLPLPTQA